MNHMIMDPNCLEGELFGISLDSVQNIDKSKRRVYHLLV